MVKLRELFKVGWALPPVACISSYLNGERGIFKGSDAPQRMERSGGRTMGRCGFDSHCRSRGEETGCSATGSRPSTGWDTHLEPFQLATPCNAMHAAFMAAIRDWGTNYTDEELCAYRTVFRRRHSPLPATLANFFRVTDRPKHRSLPVPASLVFCLPFPRPRHVGIRARLTLNNN